MTPSFASDNYAGIHPKVLEKIQQVNVGSARAYGGDEITHRAKFLFKKHFGHTCEPFFVFNGTGANVLGLATVIRPYHSVLCSKSAHIQVDECGAPESFIGCKLELVPAHQGKLYPEDLEAFLLSVGDQHHVQPKVISISQSTELGTVYSIEELKKLAQFVRKHHLYFHMDGARLCNAAASLHVSLKELTMECGIDILSFGGTKNGLLAAEAVIFFSEELARDFPFIRKQGMQLSSKMRFFAAQFEALLEEDLWLNNARHANAMAQYLKESINIFPEITLVYPVQSNAVFAQIPFSWIAPLNERTPFYVWDAEKNIVRWMTSFETTKKEIDQFIQLIQETRSKYPQK